MQYALPDWLLIFLRKGVVDHLEYADDGTTARAFFANGSEMTISIAVTDEILRLERDAERARAIAAGGHFGEATMRISHDGFRGVVFNRGT